MNGKRVDVLRGFRYRVTIQPHGEGDKAKGGALELGFSKVSGLGLGTSDVIEYREGNEIVSPRKIPGLNKYDNVTFEQGRAKGNAGSDLASWRKAVVDSEGGSVSDKGTPSSDGRDSTSSSGTSFLTAYYRATVKVELINREGKPAITWTIKRAWPVSVKFSDLDGLTSDALIQTMELATEAIDEEVNKIT
jgi:phage tail-like protein